MSYFFIHSISLCLLVEAFTLFMFKVIIDTYVLIAILLIVLDLFLLFCFVLDFFLLLVFFCFLLL